MKDHASQGAFPRGHLQAPSECRECPRMLAGARARVRACVSANITAVKRFQSVSAHVAKRRALLNEYCSM
jgi:hypothetical protein